MKELYDIIEQMALKCVISIGSVIYQFTNRLEVMDLAEDEAWIMQYDSGQHIIGLVYPAEGKLFAGLEMVDSIYNIGDMVDIGDGIRMQYMVAEPLYEFFLRNDLLDAYNQFNIQKMIIEHA